MFRIYSLVFFKKSKAEGEFWNFAFLLFGLISLLLLRPFIDLIFAEFLSLLLLIFNSVVFFVLLFSSFLFLFEFDWATFLFEFFFKVQNGRNFNWLRIYSILLFLNKFIFFFTLFILSKEYLEYVLLFIEIDCCWFLPFWMLCL